MYYMFWIKSSRGTDSRTALRLKDGLKKEDVEEILEEWCSNHSCTKVSENYWSYGFKKLGKSLGSRRERLKKYNAIVKQKNRIDKKWKDICAILNPKDWRKRGI